MRVTDDLTELGMLELVETCPAKMTPQEMADFLDGTPEERKLVIASFKAAKLVAEASGWDKFVAVVKAIYPIIPLAGEIAGSISAVYGLGQI